MTRTLITGAGGFTGRYLTALLQAKGHIVHALERAPDNSSHMGPQQIHFCDILDRQACERVIAVSAPDHVVHLAAISFVAHENRDEMYRTNLLGTRNLLDALSQAAHRPTSILIASSASIYGRPRQGTLTEDMAVAPINDYGVTKAGTELIAGMYADRLPIIVARPFNYTGVGQAANFLIPKIVDHVRRRASVIELGNVDIARDFSDVRTVVDAYARLLSEPVAIGQTFNICSGHATSLRDLLDMAQHISGHTLDVAVNPVFVRADDVSSLFGSTARIESVIGPLSSIPLSETLNWMISDER